MKRNLKLYVWTNVFSDYTPGVAFALASSEEEAKELIIKHKGEWSRDYAMRELANKPDVYIDKFGYTISGGG